MNDFLGLVTKPKHEVNLIDDLNALLEYIFDQFKDMLPYNGIGIGLMDNSGFVYDSAVKTDQEFESERGFIEKMLLVSSDFVRTRRKIHEHNYYGKLHSNIVYPLIYMDEILGEVSFSCKTPDAYGLKHIKYIKLVADCILNYLERNSLVDNLLNDIVNGFIRLIEVRDIETGMHITRIQLYSKIIAEGLNKSSIFRDKLSNHYIDGIYKFSPLHDIGKVSIPDSILLKPSQLSPQEFEEIKKHTIIGADVLRKTSKSIPAIWKSLFNICIQIAESHHEKYDGSGYPYGLSRNDIPLCARIVSVADVFDALTTKRVYKNAFEVAESLRIIREESGKSFDPEIVRSFLDNKDEILSIYELYHEKSCNVV